MKSPTINAVACACGGALVGQQVTFLIVRAYPNGDISPVLSLIALLLGVFIVVVNLAVVKQCKAASSENLPS